MYHADLGYIYIDPTPADTSIVYIYDLKSGHWWYTGATLFPDMFDFTLNAWLEYIESTTNLGHYTSNPRSFYNLSAGGKVTF